MEIIKLNRERVWRTYLGGSILDNWCGLSGTADGNFPEQWILSDVAADGKMGLSKIEGTETTLKSLIIENPEKYLGTSENNFLGVLIKLLDSSERLTIQVHPDRSKGMRYFHSPYGKTECWHILDVRKGMLEEPCVYIGFKAWVTRQVWQDIFIRQDISAMLGCLHKFKAEPGDTFLIEGGVPHAIGAGCFIAEIQEPTDITLRSERKTPSGLEIPDILCHGGVGFENMLDCFNYNGNTFAEAAVRFKIPAKRCGIEKILIGYDNTEFFRLTRFTINETHKIETKGVFSGMCVIDGHAVLETENETITAQKGDALFIPASVHEVTVSAIGGSVETLQYWGPDRKGGEV